MKKTLYIILITFLILTFVVLAMGGGHGTFLPAKLIYPYSMIITLMNNQIGILSIIIAIIQIPLYSIAINKKSKWTFLILGIHIVSTIISMNIPTETFSG